MSFFLFIFEQNHFKYEINKKKLAQLQFFIFYYFMHAYAYIRMHAYANIYIFYKKYSFSSVRVTLFFLYILAQFLIILIIILYFAIRKIK
jgi:hypothetical protein